MQDSAANLLSLSGAAQAVATSLRLSAPQTVTVQQLAGLAALGGKFTEAGNAVTVQGSVAALEALAPPALALATQIARAGYGGQYCRRVSGTGHGAHHR